MLINNDGENKLVIKYWPLYENSKGGIFSPDARKRLLGTAEPYKEDYAAIAERTFWNRQIEYTKTALIDLALFFETAPKKEIKAAIELESVKKIINAFFNIEFDHAFSDIDVEKVRIAYLMIERAFYYLTSPQFQHLIKSYEHPHIKNGVEVADSLSDRAISYLEKGEKSN